MGAWQEANLSNDSDGNFSFLVAKFCWFTFEKIHKTCIFFKSEPKNMAIKKWNSHLNCRRFSQLLTRGFWIRTSQYCILHFFQSVRNFFIANFSKRKKKAFFFRKTFRREAIMQTNIFFWEKHPNDKAYRQTDRHINTMTCRA